MQLQIKVIPGARKNSIKETEGGFTVYVTAPANDGKANQALINMLSEHFDVAKGHIEIVQGLKSRHKRIHIEVNYC